MRFATADGCASAFDWAEPGVCIADLDLQRSVRCSLHDSFGMADLGQNLSILKRVRSVFLRDLLLQVVLSKRRRWNLFCLRLKWVVIPGLGIK